MKFMTLLNLIFQTFDNKCFFNVCNAILKNIIHLDSPFKYPLNTLLFVAKVILTQELQFKDV